MGNVVNYYVDKVLQEKTITSFLEERGIFPVRKSVDKSFYLCPIHGDEVPSFVVYPVGTKGRNYQTYHCFGCHSGINLINLKSDLEGISTKEALKFFLKDVEIQTEEAIESVVDSILEEEPEIEESRDVENILFLINCTCRDYLSIYNDEEEVGFFDTFLKKVDEIARARDIETLEEVLDLLTKNGGGLEKRVESFNKRQEDEEMSVMKWRM